MYCVKCGKALPEDAGFCPSCGAAVKPGLQGTAAERIGQDRLLQQHWIKRIIAAVIDSLIVGLSTAILTIAIFFPVFWVSPLAVFNWLSFPFAVGLVSVLYFTLIESIYGSTIGKGIIGLKVEAEDGGRPSLERAFVRNVSKIYWVLLLLDVIGGFLVAQDPHQKYSDRIAHTTVV